MKTTRARRRTKRRVAVRVRADEALPEYDFNRARANTYASRYAKGSLVVTLDPDVAAVFPGAREVNDALRAIASTVSQPEVPHGQVIDLMEALRESLAKRGPAFGTATKHLATKAGTAAAKEKKRAQPGRK
jgi:hypothetical protein